MSKTSGLFSSAGVKGPKTVVVTCKPGWTVKDLKQHIARVHNSPINSFDIVYNGAPLLNESNKIEFYNLPFKECTVALRDSVVLV